MRGNNLNFKISETVKAESDIKNPSLIQVWEFFLSTPIHLSFLLKVLSSPCYGDRSNGSQIKSADQTYMTYVFILGIL